MSNPDILGTNSSPVMQKVVERIIFCGQIECLHFFLNNKIDKTSILHTCLTSCCYCFCSTAGHSLVPLYFWLVPVKNKTKKLFT